MRTLQLSQEAREALDRQLDYLKQQGAGRSALALSRRTQRYLEDTLSVYPAIGLYIPSFDVWECWIPRTRLVVWYRFDATTLRVLSIWHASQKRPQRN